MKYIGLLICLLSLGTITGCNLPPLNSPANSLAGTTWELERLGIQPAVPERKVTLMFQTDNQVGGEAGCNSYGAKYSLSGDKITISEIASTMMACMEPEIMKQEQQFLTSLEQATNYKQEDNHLVLLNAAGVTILNFVRR